MNPIYKSEINRAVAPAGDGEFRPLGIGSMSIWPPVVLAPMAGVTNFPFRAICRSFGAGLYVSEMIGARPLADRWEKTLKLADFGPGETPRSLQLYGADPRYVSEAVKRLVGEGRIDHLDMNFGCPVRKVTRKGGGAAIPLKPRLFRDIVRAAVASAGDVPVTIKFRLGVDEKHLTYMDSGRIAEDEGCAGVGLHARTAADLYHGEARWEAIADLKASITIPVLGNGDIWEGEDALRLMRQTGCDGVIVGRGCLGRPWLFRDLADVFRGAEPSDPPVFSEVLVVMFRHARHLLDWFGQHTGISAFRRHVSWYTKGFRLPSEVREGMMRTASLEELEALFETVDRDQPFPPTAMRVKRGKRGGTQRVVLPEGYLDDPDDATPPGVEAERVVSGG